MSDRRIHGGSDKIPFRRKAISFKTTLAMLAAVLITMAAALFASSPASAATVNWCHDPGLGGTFVCFNNDYHNGEVWQYYPNGTEQVFVSGLDYALWTRWNHTDGTWSSWTSMGGKIAWNTTPGLLADREYTWIPVVVVYGTDYNTWCRGRYTSGAWWPWARCTV